MAIRPRIYVDPAIDSIVDNRQWTTDGLDRLRRALKRIQDDFYDFADQVQPTTTSGTGISVIEDTHAKRNTNYPATKYAVGSRYIETDRGNVEYVVKVSGASKAWIYLIGTFRTTQANLPTDLGVNDKGFLCDVTDFSHVLLWGGSGSSYVSGWSYLDPSDPAGRIAGFLVDPNPTTGWHLCDGTANVSFLKSDGTLGTQSLPDLVSASSKAAYLKFGSPASATVNAAVAPTLTMNAYTPAGTIAWPPGVPTFSGNAATLTGTIAWPAGVPTFSGSALGTHQHELPFQDPAASGTNFRGINPATFGTGTSRAAVWGIATSADTTAAAVALDQPVSAGTPAGTIAWPAGVPTLSMNSYTPAGTIAWPAGVPTFTGTQATLTGTISATGEPQNLILRPWFRI